MGRLQLFDNDGSGSDDDVSKIEIDKEFAKRYEHNKKREELQKYEELKKKGVVESSSSDSDDSSEEEDDELIKPDKKKDYKFFDALIKVKKQDPILRDKDAKLFDSGSDDDDENDGSENENNVKDEKKKKKKAMYLKDVVSKQLIESGPELIDEEDEPNGDGENMVKSYNEEQQELRNKFLKAVENDNDDDDGELLKIKSKPTDEDDDDEVVEKLDEYFGEDANLDEDTKFLKEYFRNRMWIDEGKNKGIDDEGIELSEDEEEIEKQEDYEREFNFRFEENAGDRVMGHSRKIEGSVRKKDNARKLQRQRKEERIAQAEFERKEELKRLKNLKKKEIYEKLEKIREVAGIGKEGISFLDVDDLEEEFDPEEYDKKMKKAFGDGYYEADDVDPEFGSDKDDDDEEIEPKKPDFDKEDELLGLSKGWDEVNETHDGFSSARKKILKKHVGDLNKNEVGEDEDENPDESSKRKRKRKPSELERAITEQMMEEYYKLDYEDTIGDLKTRFKYRPVKPKRYGLSPEEILSMDDKDLNQYVSLKKIVPYREKEWKVPRVKTVQLKQRAKETVIGQSSGLRDNKDRKKRRHGENETTELADEVKSEKSQSNGDANAMSKTSKRRRRQAELKLSQSRLMAYGKIPSKSKSKN